MSKEDTLRKTFALMFQAHPWHGVSPGENAPEKLNAFVEMVPTDTVKYELDKASGLLKVDRPQRFSSLCPSLYGFIPQTLCDDNVADICAKRTGRSGIKGDGDPMDICILSERAITHGNLFVTARPVGGLRMIDSDEADDKIIAVLEDDLAYGGIANIDEVPKALVDRLRHYFLSYKQLPNRPPDKVEIAEVYGRQQAIEVVEASFADYRRKYGQPEDRLLAIQKLLGG